jgi:RNA recognition motif-containing protein
MYPFFVHNCLLDATNGTPTEGKRNLETPCSFFSLDVSILGYAFIYFEEERDAEDAIRRLDNVSFGYNRCRLSVDWSRVNPFLSTWRGIFVKQPECTLLITIICICYSFSKLNLYQGAVIGLLGM